MSRPQKQDVASIYNWVVDDVITSLKADLDEPLLHELRELWDKKLSESGVMEPHPTDAKDEPATGDIGASGSGQKRPARASGGAARKRKTADPEAGAGKAAKASAAPPGDGSATIPQQDGNMDEPGEALNDDEALDDDEDEEDEEGDGKMEYANYMCAQFEKVNRVKSRWKVNMKDGVFHVGGRDYLFHKGTGEFIFK